MTSIPKTQFDDLSLVRQGKVRDIFDTGEALLMVTTDRLSAYDVVLPDLIPDKGKVLNQISVFWFKLIEDIVSNHIISRPHRMSALYFAHLACRYQNTQPEDMPAV